jgi:hypothetical protein
VPRSIAVEVTAPPVRDTAEIEAAIAKLGRELGLLEPRKLAVIVALAAEMLTGSNAEALVTDALTRATGLAIDAALFDFEAADEVRAAGLRHGIAASTASTATSARYGDD